MIFTQSQPNVICQSRIASRNGQCDNPRCSIECRYNWAWKEYTLLIHRLNEIKADHFIYFGNITFQSNLSSREHIEIRKEFLNEFRKNDKKRNATSKILFNSEPNRDTDRIHYHYCMYSDAEWTQHRMKSIWNSASGGISNIVKHDPPKKGIVPACKYMFKFSDDYRGGREHVNLLSSHAPQIVWSSRGFYDRSKTDLWKLIRPKRQTL